MRALLLALLVGVGGAAVGSAAAAATGNNKLAELSHNLASQRGYELLEDQTVSPAAPTADEPADEHHEVHRYPVASVEFARVETPFIIGLWIFCASLAKIGECQNIFWNSFLLRAGRFCLF
jgi:hypothetical protein